MPSLSLPVFSLPVFSLVLVLLAGCPHAQEPSTLDEAVAAQPIDAAQQPDDPQQPTVATEQSGAAPVPQEASLQDASPQDASPQTVIPGHRLVPARPPVVLDAMGMPGRAYMQAWRMMAQAVWEEQIDAIPREDLPSEGTHLIEVQLKLGEDGTVLETRVNHSSGWSALDESVRVALSSTSPVDPPPDDLELDEDGFLPAMQFTLTEPDSP